MSIKRLTRAAEAAGYAMAEVEDISPQAMPRDPIPTGQPPLARASADPTSPTAPGAAVSVTAVAQQWFGSLTGK